MYIRNMNYQQTLDYLYGALPMYQRVGKKAFKKDLTNTVQLCDALGNPQSQFKSVHVAGTNGKGSCSHAIASVLQAAGYKTGLYTSPHLKDFTERTKINGMAIPQQSVIDFVQQNQRTIEDIKPSFFEMTVAMAFDHFARERVDIAIIETGLGGRLDSTNVIMPEACLITNIGYDHQEMLGDTLEKIAYEKAGIIKRKTPVVIGNTQQETTPVFKKVADESDADIFFADAHYRVIDKEVINGKRCVEIFHLKDDTTQELSLDLLGDYQLKNLPGVLGIVDVLRKKDFKITPNAVTEGLSNVVKYTQLKGRWQVLAKSPMTICDTGHNKEAFKQIMGQINKLSFDRLHLVLGFVNDKEVKSVLDILPVDAQYYFCQAKVPRAMPLEVLKSLSEVLGKTGVFIKDVNKALAEAKKNAGEKDLIYIGGSTFVVAEIEGL